MNALCGGWRVDALCGGLKAEIASGMEGMEAHDQAGPLLPTFAQRKAVVSLLCRGVILPAACCCAVVSPSAQAGASAGGFQGARAVGHTP